MFHFHSDEDHSINPISAMLGGLSSRRQYSARPIKTPDEEGGDMEGGDLSDRLHARHAREQSESGEVAEAAPREETSWVGPPMVKVIRPSWKQQEIKRPA